MDVGWIAGIDQAAVPLCQCCQCAQNCSAANFQLTVHAENIRGYPARCASLPLAAEVARRDLTNQKSSVKTATAGAVLLQDSELAQALAASKLDVDRASACLRLRTWTPTAAAGGERQVKDDCSCFRSVAYAPGANPTTGFFWLPRSTIAGHKGDHRSTESNSKMLVRALEWPVNQWESFKLSARY